jgi:23S rRNA pseudouridine2604 synthase
MTEHKVRINKFLSQAGFCSRREADKFILDERVTINGVVAKMGEKIDPNDDISVDGERISKKPNKKIYIILNKPKGIVCTTDSGVEKNNIIDYVNHPKRIFPNRKTR